LGKKTFRVEINAYINCIRANKYVVVCETVTKLLVLVTYLQQYGWCFHELHKGCA